MAQWTRTRAYVQMVQVGLSATVFFLFVVQLFFFRLVLILNRLFSLRFVSIYFQCWLLTASGGFYDKRIFMKISFSYSNTS